jgi:NitT/TauT family transport system permease protein
MTSKNLTATKDTPDHLAKAPVRKSAGRMRLENLAWQICIAAAFFALWEYASERWISALLVSKPSRIAQTMWEWTIDGTYVKNIWVTLKATLMGFGAGAIGGMMLGYITATWRRVGEVLEPFVTAFYTLPRLALAPLFLMWFGLGMEFRVVFAATIVFFLVYYNTYYGVREVSNELLAAVRIMGANRMQLALRVVIPSALVWVTAGLKISVPYALVGVVVAEMLAADEGVGYLLAKSASQFSTYGTFAAIAALLVMALAIDWLLTVLTRRALRWRTAGSAGQQQQ